MAIGNIGSYPLTATPFIEGLTTFRTRVVTIPNQTSQAAVFTLTPGVADAGVTTYRLIEYTTGRFVQWVSGASTTAALSVAGIAAAIQADPILNGIVSVTTTVTTVVLTTRQKGSRGSTLVFADNGSTPVNQIAVANTTAYSNSLDLPFGRGMTVGVTGNPVLAAAALSATNVFTGITVFTEADQEYVLNRGIPGYANESAVNLLKQGEIAVYSLTAVDPTKPVFLSYTADANQGRFSAVTGSGLSQITAGAGWSKATTSAGLALLQLDLP
jgi:hypothetical protein